MTRLGLRFEDCGEERRFIDQYVSGNIGWTQVAMLLGALTYVSYTIWDWVLYPQIVPTTIVIRGGVALFILLPLTFLLSRTSKRWVELILLIYCVVPGCVLTAIYLVIPSSFTHAAAGMIIVILFVSTLLPLRLVSLIIFCTLTWIALFIAEGFAPEFPAGLRFINHFEIGTAYALSLWAVGAREYQARRQFRTAEALHIEKERTEATLEELRATQAHLVQAEKLASLGQIVAGVAHEVSTPVGLALTTSTTMAADVSSMSDVILSGQVRRSELTRIINRLKEGLDLTSSNLLRASELIYSFKQVAIDQSNEDRRVFDLNKWLGITIDKLKPLLARHKITVEVDCFNGIEIDGFPGPLAQVISHLAMNAAIHAYPDGLDGQLTVAATRIDDGWIRIAFTDAGIGIEPVIQERVFDPFFTTRRDKGNVGLGLHIVHNIVVATMAGRIGLESRKNAGTTISVEIPVSIV